MIPFRERNPLPIGAVGLGLIALLLLGAFNAQNLPVIGSGDTYHAAFSEAGGIRKDDDVRIAGVRVGKVTGIELENAHVRVDFTITADAAFGPQTGASIRMKTLLGQKYVALEPKGAGQLSPESGIPLGRTVSSYDIVNAFADLTTTTEKIDTGQLAGSQDDRLPGRRAPHAPGPGQQRERRRGLAQHHDRQAHQGRRPVAR